MTQVARWALAAVLVAGSGTSRAQNFISEGPGTSIGPSLVVQSRDLAPTSDPATSTGTVSGAIQAIVVDPDNPGTLYIGAVNGGVWKSQNNGASWTPLTDKQLSLSIASLTLDPTDPTGEKIYAGTGATSNSNIGGQKIGILYSPDGGTTWSVLGSGTLDKSVIGIVARGNTIVAAESEPLDPSKGGGLYISTNGGSTFSQVTGVPAGAVASLVSASTANAPLYAVVNSADPATRGIYIGSSNGSTWTQVSSSQVPIGINQSARLAAGPNGSVLAGVYQYSSPGSSSASLVSLYLSQDGGAHWTQLVTPPDVNTGAQALTNLTLAVDPKNPSIVYVAGDASNNEPYTVPAYRIVLNADGTSTYQTLTLSGTSNNSAPHADSRAFAFDSAGNMYLTEDGGIYYRTSPQTASGAWTGLNVPSLAVREGYAVAYDTIGHRLVISAQDTGSAYQMQPGQMTYTALGPADGVNAVANDRTRAAQGYSAIYTSYYNLQGVTRWTYNAAGTQIAVQEFNSFNLQSDDNPPFSSLIVLNKKDPSKIAIGTNYVYTTVDAGAQSTTLDLTVRSTFLGDNNGDKAITAIAYGTGVNVDALLVGAYYSSQGLYYTASAGSNLTNLSNYTGGPPSSVVFDYRSDTQFYAVDGTTLWSGSAATPGGSFTQLDLSSVNIIRPSAVEFISNNGVNALLVGGLSSITGPQQSPLAVANSSAVGTLSPFQIFGADLPNTIVYQLAYNPTADVLAVSMLGRGIWVLYDVTTYFTSATTLIFGAADNDSTPTDAQLVAGTGPSAGRGLDKVGTGTLTINGTSGYTGATDVIDGTLLVNGNITSSSGVTVGANGTLGGTGVVPSTVVNGTLAPGNPTGQLTVAGNLTFNPGSTYQVQVAGTAADSTLVTGNAGLAGSVQGSFGGGSLQRSYTILSAANLTGAFSGLTTTGLPGFLSASLAYSPTSVSLNLQSGMAMTPGLAGNQSAVARAFDVAFNAGPGLGNMPALFGLTSGQLPQALETLSGDSASVAQSASIAAGNQFASLLTDRAVTRRNDQLACHDAPDKLQACETPPDWSAWTAGFGGASWLSANAGTGSSSSQQTIAGGAVGGDYRAGPGTLVGFAIAGSSLGYSMPANAASGQATGVHFGIYGLQDWQGFYVNAALVYSIFNGSMTRQIASIGATETERSVSTASQLGGRLEVGRAFALGSASVTPFAAIQPSQFWQPATTESSTLTGGGPGVFGLSYQAQSTTSLPSFLGTQFDVRTELGSQPLNGWLRLAWKHEFMTARPVTAGFVTLPGSQFTVDGALAPSDAARIDVGARYALNEQISLFANASAELSGSSQSIGGTAGFKWVW